MNKKKNIILFSIPRHIEIKCNSRVDMAALDTNVDTRIKVPYTDFKEDINIFLINVRFTWMIIHIIMTIQPKLCASNSSFMNSRKEEEVTSCLCIGHTRMALSFLLTIVLSMLNSILSIKHILTEFPD